MSQPLLPTVSLRWAGSPDDEVLTRLAQLDSTPPLERPVLMADRDGVPVAALSLADGRVAADPFKPTAEVVALLRLGAAHLESGVRARRRGLQRLAFG